MTEQMHMLRICDLTTLTTNHTSAAKSTRAVQSRAQWPSAPHV